MTFNIGNQYGTISNVAGNQTVYGGQHANMTAPPEVLDAIKYVYTHLDNFRLSPEHRTAARSDLENLHQEVAAGRASQQQVSQRLSRVLSAARNAGAVLNAASSLGTAITTIAKWLGPLGTALVGFLI